MDLLILRHGESGKRSPLPNDSKRTLTAEGRQEILELSNGLKSLQVKLDYVLSSPLLRAKDTAEIVAKSLKYNGKIEELNSLKPEGSRLEFYSTLSKLKQDSVVLVVGHEPYLSQMISEAISQSECRINLKKAGLARIRVLSTLPKLRGDLKWLLTPKLLKKLA
jgi:phosphohistidine phosphatase